jgi:protein phosphatase inhibitor 2
MGDSSPEQMQEENNGVAAGATTDGGSSGDAAPIESVHFPGAAGIPVKPALAHKSKKKNGSPKKSSNKKSDRHLKWDEAKIREHDKERGTRMKIEEPNTPFNHAYDSGNETDGSASSARNNSKTQISWDALTNKLEAHAAVTDAYPSSPSSYGGDMSEHEHEERDKERKKMEFEEHRKRHYNEMELVRRFRAQHPDEEDDDEDDDADDEKE